MPDLQRERAGGQQFLRAVRNGSAAAVPGVWTRKFGEGQVLFPMRSQPCIAGASAPAASTVPRSAASARARIDHRPRPSVVSSPSCSATWWARARSRRGSTLRSNARWWAPSRPTAPARSSAWAAWSRSIWATACWPISAIRRRTRTTPSARYARDLSILAGIGDLKPAPGVTLQARIGVATGVVVVGDLVREGVTQEKAAVGETTNLAARLQSLAEPNTLLICPETHRLVGALFDYRDLGRQTLKGFANPVHVRHVTGASRLENRFEARRADLAAPLLGRDEELDLLARRWQQAKAGEGRVVLITGEPGIGKSRLTRALLERLQAEPHTRLQYHCSPYHQDSALHPIISQLVRAAGIEHEDAADRKLGKLEAVLAPTSRGPQRNRGAAGAPALYPAWA